MQRLCTISSLFRSLHLIIVWNCWNLCSIYRNWSVKPMSRVPSESKWKCLTTRNHSRCHVKPEMAGKPPSRPTLNNIVYTVYSHRVGAPLPLKHIFLIIERHCKYSLCRLTPDSFLFPSPLLKCTRCWHTPGSMWWQQCARLTVSSTFPDKICWKVNKYYLSVCTSWHTLCEALSSP